MAKTSKKSNNFIVPVDTVKLLILFLLAVLLASSLFVLFSDSNSGVGLIDPVTVTEQQEQGAQ